MADIAGELILQLKDMVRPGLRVLEDIGIESAVNWCNVGPIRKTSKKVEQLLDVLDRAVPPDTTPAEGPGIALSDGIQAIQINILKFLPAIRT